MKTRIIKNPLLLPVLIAGLGVILVERVTAQTFTTLHSFASFDKGTNSDGVNVIGGLILSSNNTLYGTALYGASLGNGAVFAVNADGTGFRTVYSFSDGSDGKYPHSGVILSSTTLYGMAAAG